jgi:hypothetical protein
MKTKTTKKTAAAKKAATAKATKAPKAKSTAATAAAPGAEAPKPAKAAKAAKPAKEKAPTKGQTVLGLIQRKGGATAAELQAATGWQAHSVRGFLSAVAGKRLGLKLTSARREDGQRVYSVEA